MTLVNIVPHVILHQKTHVPWAVNFFESQKASQHPVPYSIHVFNYLVDSAFTFYKIIGLDILLLPFSKPKGFT